VSYRIIFTRPSQRDLRQIGDFLRDVAGASVARRWVEEIVQAAESLREMPTRQRERIELMAGLRSIPLGDYMIFYRVAGTTVQILRVLHGARDITSKLFARER
jgi:toxin ParE1/3/4